jgi:hypothetical protein
MEPKAALEAISRALFPPSRKEEGAMVSADAYLNLEGVRLDLTRMGADPVCIRTIASVQQQLLEVSAVLRRAGFEPQNGG